MYYKSIPCVLCSILVYLCWEVLPVSKLFILKAVKCFKWSFIYGNIGLQKTLWLDLEFQRGTEFGSSHGNTWHNWFVRLGQSNFNAMQTKKIIKTFMLLWKRKIVNSLAFWATFWVNFSLFYFPIIKIHFIDQNSYNPPQVFSRNDDLANTSNKNQRTGVFSFHIRHGKWIVGCYLGEVGVRGKVVFCLFLMSEFWFGVVVNWHPRICRLYIRVYLSASFHVTGTSVAGI